MKRFFALCILLIGLVAMPPGPLKASSIDHGISFVTDVGHQAPVAMIQEIGGIELSQVSVLTVQIHLDAALPESNLITDKLAIMTLPAIPMIYVDRLCQLYLAANQKLPNLQGLQSNQKISINPFEIRADSQI